MNSVKLIGALLLTGTSLMAQRQHVSLNDNWQFTEGHVVEKNVRKRVDIPHTWNTTDALVGKLDYNRGLGNYEKTFKIDSAWQGKRVFIKFDGVNTVSNLFINGKHIGEHRGGYTSFVYEITDKIDYNKDNKFWVRVNNAPQLDVMPLVGDFNFYGGIYRDVTLLVTDPVCISPLDYASPGVYLSQTKVTKDLAQVSTDIVLSNGANAAKEATLRLTVKDGDKVVLQQNKPVTLAANTQVTETIPFEIAKPRLWNGQKDPFMYSVDVELIANNVAVDKVTQPLGLRFYHVDPAKGFFLNGEHMPLKGVCRHQDRAQIGNALRKEHHIEDFEILEEMGSNAIRLSHYPHAPFFYDLLDQNGIVAWSEIPFVGPGGYRDKGFVDQESFKANGRLQLTEMIKQNYNHPAVLFWGLFNELKEDGDNPVEYVKELNVLAKQLDPTRITTSASNQGGALNFITDLIAWNRYDGWYGGMPKDLGKFLDSTHEKNPQLCIGVSEYGAGASIYQQQEALEKTNPTSWWHPESWQTFYHEENWKVIKDRPFVWGTFIWNLFDFGAAHRTEGDRPGINDKGLVSFNRKDKKDAFYFYKANWNTKDPFVHIADKRIDTRKATTGNLKVYSNMDEVELFVNGKSLGKRKADVGTFVWEGVNLTSGKNTIKAKAKSKGSQQQDNCVITVVE